VSASTPIEWTRSDDGSAGATWNPVTGCTKVSEGCDHCYAETFAERWRGVPGHPFEQGFDLRLWPERLTLPLRWRRPRRVFLNSMSDLWHDAVGADLIARVFAVIAVAEQHTFQVLTKRPGRMHSLVSDEAFWHQVQKAVAEYGPSPEAAAAIDGRFLPNLWLGVSVETQKWASVRLDKLATTSAAAVRFASCEPLLGELDIRPWLAGSLQWVIAGGESGPGLARCTRTGPGLFVISAWSRVYRTASSSGAPLLLRLMVTIVAGSTSSTAAARAGMGWKYQLVLMPSGCAGSARAERAGCLTAGRGMSSLAATDSSPPTADALPRTSRWPSSAAQYRYAQ